MIHLICDVLLKHKTLMYCPALIPPQPFILCTHRHSHHLKSSLLPNQIHCADLGAALWPLLYFLRVSFRFTILLIPQEWREEFEQRILKLIFTLLIISLAFFVFPRERSPQFGNWLFCILGI